MYTMLKEHANSLGRDAARFAAELVRTPSPSLCEINVARIVERKMTELGYDKVVVDDFGNVFGIVYGMDGGPTVLLNSHMDTVDADMENSNWEFPPYSGEIEGDSLHGLGSADCKAGIAVQTYAGYLLKRALLPLRGNLIVAATVSEENGLSLGVQHLITRTLADMKMKVDYAILGEPTDLGLFYGHDGWAEFKIGLDGPDQDFLQEAANLVFNNLLSASQAKGLPSFIELMNVREPRFDQANGDAYITFNRRLFSGDNTETLVERIKEFSLQDLREKSDVNLDIRIREEAQKLGNGQTVQVRYLSDAWETNPFSPIMDRSRQALESAGCKNQPGKWLLPRLGMGTAGSVLTKRFNIPTIGYGPGREDQAHSPNENVSLGRITEGILGTASIVHSLAGIPVFGWTSDLEI